jgi:hypothetical protein
MISYSQIQDIKRIFCFDIMLVKTIEYWEKNEQKNQ